MTYKLYYDNLYSKEFDAHITSQSQHDGKFFITLDQTLFYPSGGGQPCDLGTIDGVEVLDVHEQGHDIIHVLASPLTSSHVHGVLDWQRRFELMQQHLGEHLFAGCLFNLHGLHTQRMRIEGDNVSIDTDKPADLSIILEAERAANSAIWADISVQVIYPGIDEIKAQARKLPPENAELPIRIIKVEGVDYVPCCGLHVSSTGQVGLVKITSVENHKGGSRIYMRCGASAYRWLDDVYHVLRKAESELVCGTDGINDKIAALKAQIHDLKAHNEATLERFMKPLADDLAANAETLGTFRIVKHVMKPSGQDEVKHLYRLLTENHHDVIALIAGESESGVYVMTGTHKENKNVDVRPAFRKVIAALEGKGGGTSFCAQGSGRNTAGVDEALGEAVSEIVING